MKTLSACLIVKNEELVIERCIRSLIPICDEIIICDTGSIDKTKSILDNLAEEYDKIKLFDFKWIDDFSAARNFSFSKATCDYLMWVDSDEVFTDDLNRSILELKENDFYQKDSVSTYIMFYDGKDNATVYRERILKRSNNPYWKYRVHELLFPKKGFYKEEILLPLTAGYVFHEKKKESNIQYYAQIFYDELNKNEMPASHHNWYYFSWMNNYFDKELSKILLYNVFYYLPDFNESDYRTYYLKKDSIITRNEYEALETISMHPIDINNIKYMLLKSMILYKRNELYASYYYIKYLYDNRLFLFFDKKNIEKMYEHYSIILWNIGLINEFVDITSEFIKQFPDNEIAVHNMDFINGAILPKRENINLIIDLKDKKWNLPYLLYLTKDIFNKRFIINNGIDINDIVDNSVTLVKDKNELLAPICDSSYYLYMSDDTPIRFDSFISLIKNYINSDENFEFNEKKCIFVKNKEKLAELLKS